MDGKYNTNFKYKFNIILSDTLKITNICTNYFDFYKRLNLEFSGMSETDGHNFSFVTD